MPLGSEAVDHEIVNGNVTEAESAGPRGRGAVGAASAGATATTSVNPQRTSNPRSRAFNPPSSSRRSQVMQPMWYTPAIPQRFVGVPRLQRLPAASYTSTLGTRGHLPSAVETVRGADLVGEALEQVGRAQLRRVVGSPTCQGVGRSDVFHSAQSPDGKTGSMSVTTTAESQSRFRRLSREAVASLLIKLHSPPNLVTAARLLLVFVLWGLALSGHSVVVGIGLGLAFLTDVADGYLARRLNRISAFGSKFDSIVDGTIAPSAIVWILLLHPEVLTDHLVLAGLWVATTYASLAIGLVRHRRFANLHLQSSRIAGVAQYAFLVEVFVASSYSPRSCTSQRRSASTRRSRRSSFSSPSTTPASLSGPSPKR